VLDRFRDQCGVVGVWGDSAASRLAWGALLALQHRGEEAAGIAVAEAGQLRVLRGPGRVETVFGEGSLASLSGSAAIGHVRYGTAGGQELANIQPLLVRSSRGPMAVAHNGNLTNAEPLRRRLEAGGSLFAGSSDTEVILHLIAASRQETRVNRIVEALYQVEGAYSIAMLTEDGMLAVRDPWGFRPLVLGSWRDAWIVASETCALDAIGADLVREIEPGEMLIIDASGVQSVRPFPPRPRRACIFEQIYFSRADSRTFGLPVYETRRELGVRLAQACPVPADVVIGVPDSGMPGAVGFASASGIPFEHGLLRSPGVGRTFMLPGAEGRDTSVQQKLTPVRSVVEGRRVVVVDDSLVRGTTARETVRMLLGVGAVEVHMRITSPPTTGPCFYGVDTPEQDELLAHRLSVQEIQTYLGAASLAYLPLDALREVQGEQRGGFCEACFTGEYPVLPDASPVDAQVPLFGRPHGT